MLVNTENTKQMLNIQISKQMDEATILIKQYMPFPKYTIV